MKQIFFRYFFLSIILLGCRTNNPLPITLFIPDGFTGQVIILYNQPDMPPPKLDAGRFVFTAPSNGIIKTSYNPNGKTWDIKCYYGKNKKLLKGYNPYYSDLDEDGDTTSLHFTAGRVGSFGSNVFQELFISKPPATFSALDKIDSLHFSSK